MIKVLYIIVQINGDFMHIHWHKFDHKTGVNNYFECRCGHRITKRSTTTLVGPTDKQWLNHKPPAPRPIPPQGILSDDSPYKIKN